MSAVLTFLAALIEAALDFVFRRKPKDPGVQAVQATNAASHASAEVARDTSHQLNADLSHVDQETTAAADRLRTAGSLREQRDAVSDAIARANQDAGADGSVR